MEKLQAAIEKARASRKAIDELKKTEAPSAPTNADAAWGALQAVSLNEKHLKRNRVIAMEHSAEARTYDMLRTKMLQQTRANKWKRVAVTSPTKGCGKTTICCNLASSLGRQTDRRTIVFDLDMRRPGMAKVLGIQGKHSFFEVLEESIPFAEQAVSLGKNVALSVNFAHARNPTELLQRDQTTRILDQIEATYKPDLMIFDMPPMLVSDDTHAFLKNVDCALLVGATESSTASQIDVCERDIAEQTGVLGVVLNKCRYMDKSYGYDYY